MRILVKRMGYAEAMKQQVLTLLRELKGHVAEGTLVEGKVGWKVEKGTRDSWWASLFSILSLSR